MTKQNKKNKTQAGQVEQVEQVEPSEQVDYESDYEYPKDTESDTSLDETSTNQEKEGLFYHGFNKPYYTCGSTRRDQQRQYRKSRSKPKSDGFTRAAATRSHNTVCSISPEGSANCCASGVSFSAVNDKRRDHSFCQRY